MLHSTNTDPVDMTDLGSRPKVYPSAPSIGSSLPSGPRGYTLHLNEEEKQEGSREEESGKGEKEQQGNQILWHIDKTKTVFVIAIMVS